MFVESCATYARSRMVADQADAPFAVQAHTGLWRRDSALASALPQAV
jgi:hypothetical protein